MASKYKPLGPDDDGITYLPIDHTGAKDESRYTPTDLRRQNVVPQTPTPQLGKYRLHGRALSEDQMPPLEPEQVAQACDEVVKGHKAYANLLKIGLARPSDIPALWEASMSGDIKTRWERLWVLSPLLSRLCRAEEAKAPLVQLFSDDLAGVHLLSKFAEQNNPAVKRLFNRLKIPLLHAMLAQMCQSFDDPRKASLLSSIIALLETQLEPLRQALPTGVPEDVREDVLAMLDVREGKKYKRLSATTIRDKLTAWRRGGGFGGF